MQGQARAESATQASASLAAALVTASGVRRDLVLTERGGALAEALRVHAVGGDVGRALEGVDGLGVTPFSAWARPSVRSASASRGELRRLGEVRSPT
ncbi:MAG: hypothetical protein R3B82_04405 [Sandaracinaceae bacterium]